METRVALGGRQTVLCKDLAGIQIKGLIELPAGGIDIDNLKVFVDRANADVLFAGIFPRKRNDRVAVFADPRSGDALGSNA